MFDNIGLALFVFNTALSVFTGNLSAALGWGVASVVQLRIIFRD